MRQGNAGRYGTMKSTLGPAHVHAESSGTLPKRPSPALTVLLNAEKEELTMTPEVQKWMIDQNICIGRYAVREPVQSLRLLRYSDQRGCLHRVGRKRDHRPASAMSPANMLTPKEVCLERYL